MNKTGLLTVLWAGAVLPLASLAETESVRPGTLEIDPPTLTCLGFSWLIEGDANRNATVTVFFREQGEKDWREGMPLLRIGGEVVSRPGIMETYSVPHGFAGSILDLLPGTEYECRLVLSDPDGVLGEAQRIVRVRTREEPQAPAGGRVFHVYPENYEGVREMPAFNSPKHAYHRESGGDWAYVGRPRAQPGDVILIHAGLYKSRRDWYRDPQGMPFFGTYRLTADGTPERPITFRAAGDGEVIIDGDGAHRLIDVSAGDYHVFEGITFRNADVAIFAGMKDMMGSVGLVVRNCRFENVGIAVHGTWQRSRDFYIADNVMYGRQDPYRLVHWRLRSAYGLSPLLSYYGVKVYGQGHVICHNRIGYFHDGICIDTHGPPVPGLDLPAVSIDIYNNDIFNVCDDFVETDGGVRNIRVLRNRGFNAAASGLSAQPVFGGPAYFIRNVLYHIGYRSFKWQVRPAGLIAYHNTVVAEFRGGGFSNAHLRNNLFLATDKPGRPFMELSTYTPYTSLDYNGYRLSRAVDDPFIISVSGDGEAGSAGPLNKARFPDLPSYVEATGWDAHSIEVDFDDFRRVPPPDPRNPHAVYDSATIDFRLQPESPAIDAGVSIPNVNDDHTGPNPDLGAYELGRELPHYGPREPVGHGSSARLSHGK